MKLKNNLNTAPSFGEKIQDTPYPHWYGAKLSKRVLYNIPAGKYVVSNCSWAAGDPIFRAAIRPGEDRELLWQKVKGTGADNRHIHVFDTRDDARRFLREQEQDCVNRGENDR